MLSGVHYGGGFLDSTIESFHDTFGFSDFGRPAVVRNGTSYILDLKNSQVALFEAPTSGGMLDPTFGLRYSGLNFGKDWQVIVEAAAKVPVSGRRDLLSTGRTDYGVQMTLQKFGKQPCVVHRRLCRLLRGQPEPRAERLGDHSHARSLVTSGASPPTRTSSCRPTPVPASTRISDTDLDDLLATKYQASLGIYHRIGYGLISFAITENLQNLNNTPDIGFQLGFAFSPALLRE